MKAVLSPARRGKTIPDNGESSNKLNVKISAPNMITACFEIEGTAPLVIHRFSEKAKKSIRDTMTGDSKPGSKRKREKVIPKVEYEAASYRSRDGWHGFNAASIRCALISACRLVDFKMTLAKLSIFVQADGYDAKESTINLIRIYGKPRMLESAVRVANGAMMLCWRPTYDEWRAKLRISFDADQFSIGDVANLLSRVGTQVGIGEGRPDSRDSAGMGWGTFKLLQHHTL